MSERITSGTEIQVYDTSDRQPSGSFWLNLWLAAIIVALIYSLLCFTLGFRTKGIVS